MTWAPRAMKRENKITTKEMRESIFRSGYLLEQRAESVLEKRGYYVTTNTAYPDPATGKSREIDIKALTALKLSRDYDFLYPNLICECENNEQPIVLFTKDSPVSFLNYQEVKSAGIPIQFLEKSTPTKRGYKIEDDTRYIGLSDFLNFEKYHHYCKGLISTQYCTFSRKNTRKPWVAFHSDIQHNSLTNLIFALESEIDEYYKDYVLPEKTEKELININIYYPVLILQGPLYAAQMKKGNLTLKRAKHLQYKKEYFSKDKHDTYQIDVITEAFLPKYLDVIEEEMEKAKNILRRKKKIVRESLDKLVQKARKKNKSKTFREIFEF